MDSEVFTFTDIQKAKGDVIAEIIKRVPLREIAKALNREPLTLRKRFYEKSPSLDDMHDLREMINAGVVESHVKIKAQEKILSIIAAMPEYKNYRFQSRFGSEANFHDYLTRPLPLQKLYGFEAENTSEASFFTAEDGWQVLDEIDKKNKKDGCEVFCVPHTKIRLANYSQCPHCGRVYSLKELSHYFAHPKIDHAFKKGIEIHSREDARMFCGGCKKYFLPSLLVIEGAGETPPKNQVQFLGRMQTVNAIEEHYCALGHSVLTRNEGNFLKNDGVGTRQARCLTEEARHHFIMEVINLKEAAEPSRILKGIRCDIFLKELENSPALLLNLMQHSGSPNIALNLIRGSNVDEVDTLFGTWR